MPIIVESFRELIVRHDGPVRGPGVPDTRSGSDTLPEDGVRDPPTDPVINEPEVLVRGEQDKGTTVGRGEQFNKFIDVGVIGPGTTAGVGAGSDVNQPLLDIIENRGDGGDRDGEPDTVGDIEGTTGDGEGAGDEDRGDLVPKMGFQPGTGIDELADDGAFLAGHSTEAQVVAAGTESGVDGFQAGGEGAACAGDGVGVGGVVGEGSCCGAGGFSGVEEDGAVVGGVDETALGEGVGGEGDVGGGVGEGEGGGTGVGEFPGAGGEGLDAADGHAAFPERFSGGFEGVGFVDDEVPVRAEDGEVEGVVGSRGPASPGHGGGVLDRGVGEEDGVVDDDDLRGAGFLTFGEVGAGGGGAVVGGAPVGVGVDVVPEPVGELGGEVVAGHPAGVCFEGFFEFAELFFRGFLEGVGEGGVEALFAEPASAAVEGAGGAGEGAVGGEVFDVAGVLVLEGSGGGGDDDAVGGVLGGDEGGVAFADAGGGFDGGGGAGGDGVVEVGDEGVLLGAGGEPWGGLGHGGGEGGPPGWWGGHGVPLLLRCAQLVVWGGYSRVASRVEAPRAMMGARVPKCQ